MSKRRTILLVLGVVVVLSAAAVGGVLYFSELPGGMRPTYEPTDYDPRLTGEAKSATALIEALARYHEDHHEFPADPVRLAPYLPASPSASMRGWSYTRSRTGYTLWHKLGWDPALIYEVDGAQGRWIFDPGDGSATKVIVLSP
jgi:hypothetical protein